MKTLVADLYRIGFNDCSKGKSFNPPPARSDTYNDRMNDWLYELGWDTAMRHSALEAACTHATSSKPMPKILDFKKYTFIFVIADVIIHHTKLLSILIDLLT